jgi:hypothetical protein
MSERLPWIDPRVGQMSVSKLTRLSADNLRELTGPVVVGDRVSVLVPYDLFMRMQAARLSLDSSVGQPEDA